MRPRRKTEASSVAIQIRVTPAEFDAIYQAAKESGHIIISRWARALLLRETSQPHPTPSR
jgi:hypothetical protein